MSFFLKTQSRIEKASSPEILSILFFFFFCSLFIVTFVYTLRVCVCVNICENLECWWAGAAFFFFAATRVYVYLIYTHNVYKKRAAMGERRRNPDLHSPLINTRCNITYRAKWSTHTQKKSHSREYTKRDRLSFFFFWYSFVVCYFCFLGGLC